MTTKGSKATLTLDELESFFPSATRAECKRFLHCFSGNAKKRLEACLEWRERHGLLSDYNDDCKSSLPRHDERGWNDSKDWKDASDAAIGDHMRHAIIVSAASRSDRGGFRLYRIVGMKRKEVAQRSSLLYSGGIPQLLYSHSMKHRDSEPLRDTTNHCVLHFLPALIDLNSFGVDSTLVSTTFATAIALYLHTKFEQQCRWSRGINRRGARDGEEEAEDEQWTIAMDVRPGRGWPNPPAVQMLGFMRRVTQVLLELYPGRLWRCIVFPVPFVATHVWNKAKRFLDLSVAKRIIVIPGPANLDSPLPVSKLLPYINRDCLEVLEDARLASFV
jgi:hypothetical protein